MTTKKKTQLKRAAISWLCVAALAGGSVPAGLPGIIPAVTAAAEDAIAEDHIIDLGKLVDYVSDSNNCPEGITVSYGTTIGGSENNSVIELTIKESGTYKLTGSNLIDDAYFDVKIIAAEGVNADIVCDNAYIKNTNGDYSYESSGGDDQEGSAGITSCTLYDYTYPFGTAESGQITLSGKLVVDTYTVDLYGYHRSTHFADENSHITADYTIVEYFKENDNTKDEAFYLNGAEYDASDYAGDCLCIKVNGNAVGVYTFTAGTDSIPQLYYYDDHSFGSDSDVCEHCGVEFVRYTVTFDDGSETPATERVIEGNAVAEPSSDPTAPVGKQFCGWYADEECNTKYDFDLPVTEDITLYAGWEALPVQSIAVKTAPKKTDYIEGEKFDPTGLVINEVYENGTLEVAYNDDTKNDFKFEPALTEELALTDEKVTITYGGKSIGQGITVAKKQLSSIAVKTAPKKTTYIEGEKFNPTGLVITLTYDNGKSEDVTYNDSTKGGFTFAPETLAVSDKNVTITYGGKTAQQAVTVTNKSLSSIAVKTAPKKTAYIESEKFNPTGLVITLTYNNGKTEDVAYSDSTKDGFAFAPETLAVSDKNVTITYGGKSVEQAVKVSSKSSGGSTGGSSGGSFGGSSGGGSSSTTTPTTTNPSIGGSSKSWSDVAADLGKLTSDSEATIELNGSTTVPVDVIKSIADTGSNVKLVINSAYAWVVDGSDITAPAAADLTFIKTASTKSDGLRGTEGTQFKINDTIIPTSLEIAFKTAHAVKFANSYKYVDGKLTFFTCAKLGADGKVILPDVDKKDNYVAMLCEFSDRPGDMDNDGIMNAMDASAILKRIVGLA
ncbi:MAG: bacterial Ig-like domain-containing protein [Oscillospiraceae bacterium]